MKLVCLAPAIIQFTGCNGPERMKKLTLTVYYFVPVLVMNFIYCQPTDNNNGEKSLFPNLEGVPDHLRDKILQFHKTLDAPDNFSATPPTPPPRPKYGVAGLQELAEGEVQTTTPRPQPSLQQDLFRFSDRLSSPVGLAPASSDIQGPSKIYSSLVHTRSRRKRRLEKEWHKFLTWRKRKRRKRRMRKRIMKMLKRKIESKFGPLSRRRWKMLRRNKNFRSKRKDINKRINQRLKEMRKGGKKSGSNQKLKRQRGQRPGQRTKRRKMKRRNFGQN